MMLSSFLIVGTVYMFISLFGMIGNGMIISSLAVFLKITSMTEVFICNLAIADFVFVSTLPFLATTMFYGHDFVFGKYGCHILSCCIYMSMYNSAYTVCALSIDRYFAVASPVRMRKYRTKQIALTVVVFIWFFAFVCSLPTAIFSEVQTKPNSMEDLQRMFNQSYFNQTSLSPAISGRICAPNFENNKNWMIYHTVVRFGLSFLIPLLIMIGCNVGMISALFTVVRNQSYRRKKSFLGTRKRRITKFAICIVICFLICWSPVNVSNLVSSVPFGSIGNISDSTEIYTSTELMNDPSTFHLITTCILYLNTIINPLIYSMSASSLRHRILNSIRPGSTSREIKTGPVSTIFGARNLKDAEKDETDIEFLKSATDANLH